MAPPPPTVPLAPPPSSPQFTPQRISKPDYGLREDVLLPWYAELGRQYTATPYNTWQGNDTLLYLYEASAFAAGEARYSGDPKPARLARHRPVPANATPVSP